MTDYANHKQRNYLLATKLYTQGEPQKLTERDRIELNPAVVFYSEERIRLIRDGVLLNAMISYADTDLYEITDFQAISTPAKIRGFSFVEKRWAFFLVDNLEEVTWMESKFFELELQPTFKETIQAVVNDHHEKVIRINQLSKKGQGLVVLLCGPTGTGKTLTAGMLFSYGCSFYPCTR
jgi:flagellar biosynthesis GTPase FlhF